MSIAPTRRVSSSTSVRTTARAGTQSSETGSFVEAIDASNKVSVNARLDDERRKKNSQYREEEADNEISAGDAYVQGAIEAISASGVYDEPEEADEQRQTTSKVNVYGNNQNIIQREEQRDQGSTNDARRIYESSPTADDVDELV